jgi:hypothetical protein
LDNGKKRIKDTDPVLEWGDGGCRVVVKCDYDGMEIS